ncbi:hypothetical protein [Acetobacterium malicum]|uniref:hypothetical protein n=1 Tax=Acetobacterium malicum TaxID=52692 RepID=UPI00041DDB0E|nr:hypothetical protein [Acetobacterium dehalogenans]
MSIENAIKDVISESLESGMIERLVAENLEKGINKSLENLWRLRNVFGSGSELNRFSIQ